MSASVSRRIARKGTVLSGRLRGVDLRGKRSRRLLILERELMSGLRRPASENLLPKYLHFLREKK